MERRIIKIGKKSVGSREHVFIIAEAANNHNGEFEVAKKMVVAAAEMGADAVKFQCFDADSFAVKDHPYFDVYKKLEFTKDQWKELIKTAKEGK